jgi:hypothetical protein
MVYRELIADPYYAEYRQAPAEKPTPGGESIPQVQARGSGVAVRYMKPQRRDLVLLGPRERRGDECVGRATATNARIDPHADYPRDRGISSVSYNGDQARRADFAHLQHEVCVLLRRQTRVPNTRGERDLTLIGRLERDRSVAQGAQA